MNSALQRLTDLKNWEHEIADDTVGPSGEDNWYMEDFSDIEAAAAELAAKDAEISELKSALKHYGNHHPHCPNPYARRCECGWYEVYGKFLREVK